MQSADANDGGIAPSSAQAEPLSFSFNGDGSCITVGTKDGFRIFKLAPFELAFSSGGGGPRIVEMLGSSGRVCLVGAGETAALSPRCLRLYNVGVRRVVTEVNLVAGIYRVSVNRERLIVACPDGFYIFRLKNMELLQVLDLCSVGGGSGAWSSLSPPSGTPRSSTVTYALSGDEASPSCVLATPTLVAGEVLFFDTLTLRVLHKFMAHKGEIAELCFSGDGKYLCTASVTGTLLRVFSVPSGNQVAEFRRGLQPALIHSLSFSDCGGFLTCASSGGTIHVFDVAAASQAAGALRSDVQVHPPSVPGARFMVRLLREPSEDGGVANLRLRVLATNGTYYEYAVVKDAAGRCESRLVFENTLVGAEEDLGVRAAAGMSAEPTPRGREEPYGGAEV